MVIYTMKNTFINDYRRKKTRNTFDDSNNDFHLLFSKDKVLHRIHSTAQRKFKTIDELKMITAFRSLCFWMVTNIKKLLKSLIFLLDSEKPGYFLHVKNLRNH